MSLRDRLRILEKKVLSDDWAILTRYRIAWRARSGEEQVSYRQVYDRGDGAVILPYNPVRRTVLLTRQFRLPCYVNGYDDLMIEAAAGLLEETDPEARIRAETEEELGLRLGEVRQVYSLFMSPGSVSERLFFYVATYEPADQVGPGGGVAEEGEDIETLELTIDAALEQVRDGRICDAKTVILLQHAALHIFDT